MINGNWWANIPGHQTVSHKDLEQKYNLKKGDWRYSLIDKGHRYQEVLIPNQSGETYCVLNLGFTATDNQKPGTLIIDSNNLYQQEQLKNRILKTMERRINIPQELQATAEDILTRLSIRDEIKFEELLKKHEIEKGDWLVVHQNSDWDIFTPKMDNQNIYEKRMFGSGIFIEKSPYIYLNDKTSVLKTQEDKDKLLQELLNYYYSSF